MVRMIECDCGFVVRAETDDELVEKGTKHAKEAHNIDVTREQLLALAEPA